MFLDDDLFYPFVQKPVDDWFMQCDKKLGTKADEMYTEEFHNEFESSMYFSVCQFFVAGNCSQL